MVRIGEIDGFAPSFDPCDQNRRNRIAQFSRRQKHIAAPQPLHGIRFGAVLGNHAQRLRARQLGAGMVGHILASLVGISHNIKPLYPNRPALAIPARPLGKKLVMHLQIW